MSTALITGASNGIGLELAKRLAADGHDVILVARSVDKLQALADELGGRHGIRAEVIGQDLGYEGAAQELVDKLGDRRVDMLINNAGFGEFGTFIEADIKRLNQMIQLNVATLTALAHAFGRGGAVAAVEPPCAGEARSGRGCSKGRWRSPSPCVDAPGPAREGAAPGEARKHSLDDGLRDF